MDLGNTVDCVMLKIFDYYNCWGCPSLIILIFIEQMIENLKALRYN